ncbi:hypothetical protein [Oryzomicrobium sp.]|uniref:hypothetical protein n=1 Tax=Oryzomicrobium sp. TaxID=1911578 RepID=UPI002FDF8C57
MVSLNMQGPFDLTNEEIDNKVTRVSAGNYALGTVKSDGAFYVSYVGRSDSDLNARLKQHIDKHPKFKYSYATSPEAAFNKECTNFHDFGGAEKLQNDIHPDRPDNMEFECPVCNIFD